MNFSPLRSDRVIDARQTSEVGPSADAWERLEALYRSSRDDVFAYAATLLGDRAAAEDVTALAFERAYRRRLQFDRRRGVERAWLFGIARNAALDELRRRRRIAALTVEPAATPDDGSVSGEDETEEVLRRAAVRAALAGLAPRDREVIALKFHAGLSNGEIANVLGIGENAAGSLLYRAMEKLRRACDART
jgi:RNA polymerase sigma factor (sigma-70 family)